MTDYRATAIDMAGAEHTTAVEAIARHLHYNESLRLHDNVERDEPCAYCWLRAGKAIQAQLRSGITPTGIPVNADQPPAGNLLGTVRREPNGTMIAVLWPSPPHRSRWMVTDQWGSCGYETDDAVADWPVVGAVPGSPAAGAVLTIPGTARREPVNG